MKSPFDERAMRRCLELAERAATAGNSPVGAVVAVSGDIVAEAQEEVPAGLDPFAHAEIVAVREAWMRLGRIGLAGGALYTTNEPCLLCSYAIREARLARVVIAVETLEIGGWSGRFPILTTRDVTRWGKPPQVEMGLLAKEYRELRQRFRP